MSNIQYIQESYLPVIFEAVRAYLERKNNPAPTYEIERNGIDSLLSLLDRIKSDIYYPTFVDKATHLFTTIAKDHYFSNGNKRLAIMCLALFYTLNNIKLVVHYPPSFIWNLERTFPKHDFSENPEVDGFFLKAIYHLAKIVANRNEWETKDFKVVQEGVKDFLRYSFGIS